MKNQILKIETSRAANFKGGVSCLPNSLANAGTKAATHKPLVEFPGIDLDAPPRDLLTVSNAKTLKGRAKGHETAILHFAPDNLSGYSVCPNASAACSDLCLNKEGRGKFDTSQIARIRRTRFYFQHKAAFEAMLTGEIYKYLAKATHSGYNQTFRLNGTSDLAALSFKFAKAFPGVQFYDYTKCFKTLTRKDKPQNLDLTFSRSETNEKHWRKALAIGYRVAIVTDLTFDELREYLIIAPNIKIVSGDDDDLRFLDEQGVIVVLKPKGNRIKKDKRGFALLRSQIPQFTAKAAPDKRGSRTKGKAANWHKGGGIGAALERAAAQARKANPKLWQEFDKAKTDKERFLAVLNSK